MDRPLPDPVKLLEAWMEWERGDVPPGRVMATFKTGGLRDVLEALAAAVATGPAGEAPEAGSPDTESGPCRSHLEAGCLTGPKPPPPGRPPDHPPARPGPRWAGGAVEPA